MRGLWFFFFGSSFRPLSLCARLPKGPLEVLFPPPPRPGSVRGNAYRCLDLRRPRAAGGTAFPSAVQGACVLLLDQRLLVTPSAHIGRGTRPRPPPESTRPRTVRVLSPWLCKVTPPAAATRAPTRRRKPRITPHQRKRLHWRVCWRANRPAPAAGRRARAGGVGGGQRLPAAAAPADHRRAAVACPAAVPRPAVPARRPARLQRRSAGCAAAPRCHPGTTRSALPHPSPPPPPPAPRLRPPTGRPPAPCRYRWQGPGGSTGAPSPPPPPLSFHSLVPTPARPPLVLAPTPAHPPLVPSRP